MANVRKDVRYLNKDFGQFRKNLIDFSKNYFPNTYNDFNESSPGMMFMEMASYVGDVLSFYGDIQLKESIFSQADEKTNIIAHAIARGYKPKNTIASSVKLDVFQLLPSKGSGINVKPDFAYALAVNDNMVVKAEDSETFFRTTEMVDFRYSSSLSPTEITVYQINDLTKEPEFYLLRKSVNAISGEVRTATFDFSSPIPYDQIILTDTDIIEVIDIVDSEGDKWYEVPFLAQDTIFQSVLNTNIIDPELSKYRNQTPYLLKLQKTAKRFTANFNDENRLVIQFGSGISEDADEELIPNPDMIGSALPGRDRDIDLSIDPSNFLYTKTYGLAPSNTTLTIRYTTGKGVSDNVGPNQLNSIVTIGFSVDDYGLDIALLKQVQGSVACTNPVAATGGKDREDDEEIRQNAMAHFATQNRAVTADDYMIRTYSMPPRFGAIAKCYVVQDDLVVDYNSSSRVVNPFGINLYTLGYDGNSRLTQLNAATKENLKTYLSQYKILTDGINIKDAYIINIGLDFEIITRPEYNSNEVLLRCIEKLNQLFNVKKWQINQPIVLNRISVELDKIDGVQSVVKLDIMNKYNTAEGYSGNKYDIKNATKKGIIYPSMDPSIFEIKYPSKDIRGRVVSF